MKALRLKEIEIRKNKDISIRKIMVDIYLKNYSHLTYEECYRRLANMSDKELMKLIINHHYLFYD